MTTLIDSLVGIAPAFADLLIKVTVVLTAAGVVAWLARKGSAGTRHAIWASAFMLVALLPVLGPLLPAWSVGGTDWLAAPGYVATASTAEADLVPSIGVAHGAMRVLSVPLNQAPPVARWIVFGMLGAWLVGAVLLVAQLVVHLYGVARLRARGRTPSARVRSIVAERFAALGMHHSPIVLACDAVTMPASAGLWKPAVLLPWDVEDWSRARIEAVVTHELAHIVRRDYGVHLIAEIVQAIYWVHPLVWFGAHRLTVERERACDDLALESGIAADVYAESLLAFARRQAATSSGALAMARPGGLRERVLTILNGSTNRAPVGRKTMAMILVGSLVLVVPVMTFELFAAQQLPTVDELVERLGAGDVVQARRAAWGLGEREDRIAVPPLIDALASDAADVRLVAAWALGEIKDARAVRALANLTSDPDPIVREMSALALGETEDPSAVAELTRLAEREPEFHTQVEWALSEIDSDEARRARSRLGARDSGRHELWNGSLPFARNLSTDIDMLVDALRNGSTVERRNAAWNLGALNDLRALDPLLDALRDPDPAVRAVVVWALDEINPSRRS